MSTTALAFLSIKKFIRGVEVVRAYPEKGEG
jgi:hypothetical protein